MEITKQNMVNAGSNFAARLREDEQFKEAPDEEVAVSILVSAMALAESKKLSVENLIGRAKLEMLRLNKFMGEFVTEPLPVNYETLGKDSMTLPPIHDLLSQGMDTLVQSCTMPAPPPLVVPPVTKDVSQLREFEWEVRQVASDNPIKEPGGPEPGPETENDRLRKRSGAVCYAHRLVDFLYELMKDHLNCAEVEHLLMKVLPPQAIVYSNGWLARYAHDVAQRILDQQIPEATPDPKEPARLS